MANYRSKKGERKVLTCMNGDLENSKYRAWAPLGGCDERVEVDEQVDKVLCWKCTGRIAGPPTNENFYDDVE